MAGMEMSHKVLSLQDGIEQLEMVSHWNDTLNRDL